MDIDPQTVKQTAPGLIGAIGATFFMRDPWAVRLGMVIPGGALSFFGAGWAAKVSGMPEGLAGFLLGLLGMILFGKLIATWHTLDLGAIVMDWIHAIKTRIFGGTKE